MHNQTWMTLHNSNHIVFQVKACSDAYIALSETFDNTSSAYEIALGVESGKMSEIRLEIGGSVLFSRATSNILSCGEFRAFWIAMVHQTTFTDILFGEGPKVGSKALMHHRHQNGKTVKAVSFSSGRGAAASWRMVNVGC